MDMGITKSSKWPYIIAAAVFLTGITLSAYMLVTAITGICSINERITAPGTKDISFQKTGRYTIYHETARNTGGVADLSLLRCSLVNKSTNDNILITHTTGSSSYNINDREGMAILKFHIDSPGIYEFHAGYEGTDNGPNIVLNIGRGTLGGSIMGIFAGVGVLLLTFGITVAIVLIAALRRYN
jgi:hypothetical protein